MSGSAPGPRDGPDAWVDRLRAGGLSAGAADRVARSLSEASRCLRARSGRSPEFAFFVPGRIEVFGKHTDYAGGRSLLAATEWGFGFVGHGDPGGDGLHIYDAEGGRALHLPLRISPAHDVGGWGLYPSTVVRRLVQDFPDAAGGVSVAFVSDLPPASGMSSSSALVVGTFLALAAELDLGERGPVAVDLGPALATAFPKDPDMGGASASRERLATYLAGVEAGRPFHGAGGSRSLESNGLLRGVGTDGGSEDHAAILSARPGQIVQYGFRPTRFEGATPLPPDWVFAVASSGIRAEKAEGAKDVYNRLAEETRAPARIWREETGRAEPHLGAILGASPEAADRMEDILLRGGHTRLLARFRQFATECSELVPGAAAALATGDLATLGDLAARSQALAEEVLGNQVPETIHLVASARELGAPAASAFGAGFGGAVWALVPAGDVTRFLAAWRSDYVGRFPGREAGCAFLSSNAGPAAFRLA